MEKKHRTPPIVWLVLLGKRVMSVPRTSPSSECESEAGKTAGIHFDGWEQTYSWDPTGMFVAKLASGDHVG